MSITVQFQTCSPVGLFAPVLNSADDVRPVADRLWTVSQHLADRSTGILSHWSHLMFSLARSLAFLVALLLVAGTGLTADEKTPPKKGDKKTEDSLPAAKAKSPPTSEKDENSARLEAIQRELTRLRTEQSQLFPELVRRGASPEVRAELQQHQMKLMEEIARLDQEAHLLRLPVEERELMQRILELGQKSAEMRREGNQDEAQRLSQEIRELTRQMIERRRQSFSERHPPMPVPGLKSPSPRERQPRQALESLREAPHQKLPQVDEVDKRTADLKRQITHLRQAADHLAAANMPAESKAARTKAELLQQQLADLHSKPERKPVSPEDMLHLQHELATQVQQMQRQIEKLTDQVNFLIENREETERVIERFRKGEASK